MAESYSGGTALVTYHYLELAQTNYADDESLE